MVYLCSYEVQQFFGGGRNGGTEQVPVGRFSVLPEVFTKVVEAKRYMAQGKAKSYSDAAKMAGISRSAFYKYKDFVFK